jgi:hypothetical protein
MSPNAPKSDSNGWNEYQKLVLSQLETHGQKLEEIEKAQTQILVELAGLKVKASAWGGFVGGVTSVLIAGVSVLLKMLVGH